MKYAFIIIHLHGMKHVLYTFYDTPIKYFYRGVIWMFVSHFMKRCNKIRFDWLAVI